MGGVDGPVANANRREVEFVDSETFECCTDSNHINDRVDGSHLVQFNLVGISTVDAGLDLGQRPVYGHSTVAYAFGEFCCSDQLDHLTRWSMGMMVVVAHDHIGPRCPHPAALNFFEHQRPAVNAETTDGIHHGELVGTCGNQRSHHHVARYTG